MSYINKVVRHAKLIIFLALQYSSHYGLAETKSIITDGTSIIAYYSFRAFDNEGFEIVYNVDCTFAKDVLTNCQVKSGTLIFGLSGQFISKTDCVVNFSNEPGGYEWQMKKINNELTWDGYNKILKRKIILNEHTLTYDWGPNSPRGVITAKPIDLYDSKKRKFTSYSSKKCTNLNVSF